MQASFDRLPAIVNAKHRVGKVRPWADVIPISIDYRKELFRIARLQQP
jgi:hypothetical protein